MMRALPYILFIVGGFLSGSVMYSYLIAKHFYNVDITAEGSDGNPGMSNVMDCVGKKQGLLCLFLDVMKGFIPVLLASFILPEDNPVFGLVLAAPVLGHAFTPFLHGHGGKAIAVTFGVLGGAVASGSMMLWAMSAILIIFSVIIIVNPHSLRMVVSMLFLIAWCIVVREPIGLMLGGIIVGLVVIVKHLMNFGHEPLKVKLLFSKKDS